MGLTCSMACRYQDNWAQYGAKDKAKFREACEKVDMIQGVKIECLCNVVKKKYSQQIGQKVTRSVSCALIGPGHATCCLNE